MTVTLRPFRNDDGASLLAIHIGAILATSDSYYTAVERESWAHGLNADSYSAAAAADETFIVAADDSDTPIGFCSFTPTHIVGLYVAADRQGERTGSELLRHAEDMLRRSGTAVSRIHSSQSAVGFYQSHGYVITGETNHPSRGGLAMRAHCSKKR